jgi:hypothetical protein
MRSQASISFVRAANASSHKLMGFRELVRIRYFYEARSTIHGFILQNREVHIKLWPVFRRPARMLNTVTIEIVGEFDPLSIRDPQM